MSFFNALRCSSQVVGLSDPVEDVHFPITLLSKAPSFFSSKPFLELSLLTEDEDDYSSENDEDDGDEDDDDYYDDDGEDGDDAAPPSIDALRAASGLAHMDPSEVCGLFKQHAPTGSISRDVVARVFGVLVPPSTFASEQDFNAHVRSTALLFKTFDADGNGVVDFAELASGLSILCGGSRDDKVAAAFELFDANGDGVITKEEMATYLASVCARPVCAQGAAARVPSCMRSWVAERYQ